MISYDIYLFHYYSSSSLLNRCNKLNIPVKKYYFYNNDYYLKIPRKYRNKVKESFSDFKIVDKIGCINCLEKLILKPMTLISLIFSFILFFDLSNRIYDIKFNGDYPLIENEILEVLNNEGIKKYAYSLKKDEINNLDVKIMNKLNDKIEFVEVIKEGAIINVSYKKRRHINVEDEKGNNIYATKDGVIKKFNISNGLKNVKVNQFVKKGDLLVTDTIVNNKEENIDVGTRGSVYANTYYFLDVTINGNYEEMEKYVYMLDKARNEVSKNLNSDDEYIEKEEILICDLNSGYMKIYYVLYEDITI